ncbi:GNAT family N-acetyltransferase [Aliarcobacter butzleri]|uniref:GNAT family N-acetyltransferase n=1 Tax=Aliarcobacter butzleri TaxID=28197 RepID=UPI001269BF96|nr:GNAT family N-acetyltransferase [Aliarcobacter butzleri]
MSINFFNKDEQQSIGLNIEKVFFDSIYKRLSAAEQFYPNFKYWYFQKVLPDIFSNKRDFIFENRDNNIVGLSLVKYDEKKLCTLKVFEEYQNKGLGLKLFEKSFERLDTDKPFLTVSQEKYEEFKKLFNYYKFELTSVKIGLYRDNKLEYFFNER